MKVNSCDNIIICSLNMLVSRITYVVFLFYLVKRGLISGAFTECMQSEFTQTQQLFVYINASK